MSFIAQANEKGRHSRDGLQKRTEIRRLGLEPRIRRGELKASKKAFANQQPFDEVASHPGFEFLFALHRFRPRFKLLRMNQDP